MLIRENLDKTSVAVPVLLTAAFPVDYDAVARPYRGVAFKDFIDIFPYSTVQRIAVDAARKWIKHMALQGYELMGNETEVRLWGPFRSKHHLYKVALGDDRAATSYTDADYPFLDGKAEMRMQARFLARRQHTVEV